MKEMVNNPLRTFDCKNKNCASIISRVAKSHPISEYIEEKSREHFGNIVAIVKSFGVPVKVVPQLVRWFDYYTQTVFEMTLPGLGAQDAVLGGGRYDNLVSILGGPPTPAVGASIGVERLILALKEI